MYIEMEDILAIHRENGSMICADCASEDDWDGLSEGRVITTKDVENTEGEGIYFLDCDCGKGRL